MFSSSTGTPSRGFLLLALTLLSHLPLIHSGSCGALNNCNGNGVCDTVNSRCNCFNGWGSQTDIALYKSPDCSQRTCPAANAWVDIPTGPYTAHALAECSNAGLCDRSSGRCRCFVGYEGEACQRSVCPGSPVCSSQGKCMSLKAMASEANAVPVGPAGTYGGSPGSTTWDETMIHGCVCDSTWSVGFGVGDTQAGQYMGPACAQRRCPSGDNPQTTTLNETDCGYFKDNGATWAGVVGSDGLKYAPGAALPAGVTVATPAFGTPGVDVGAPGNLCYVECSQQGLCNYNTGLCQCFVGFGGANCGTQLPFPGAGA